MLFRNKFQYENLVSLGVKVLRPADDFKERDFECVFPDMSTEAKKRAIQNIPVLRSALNNKIGIKKADRSILLASWNIKKFGHTTQRLEESYFCIAEILARFDLIAVQEVKSTLKDLNIAMRLLGDNWGYVINDITEGEEGNSERSAYIYDKSRISFEGLAGEIILWDELKANSSIKQLKRTPYMTGFKSGWKTFAMVNMHLHPGEDTDDITHRKTEVELLLAALNKKIEEGRRWNNNLVLVGDFNLYGGANKDDPTIQLLADAGYVENDGRKGIPTNVAATTHNAFDRMFVTKNDYFQFGVDEQGKLQAGVFNFFDHIFQVGDETTYKQEMIKVYGGSSDLTDPQKLQSYFKNYWRKNQMSDHLPIWFELLIDSSDAFLTEKPAEFP